ncbi:Aste57867_14331 [Aphanomyces stellatus]|uniref:Aste57867_14331 protein n=1 Tax=Aphanomyces stellatus TaxID=120398 RepID=A0A485L0E8_9STRA|nr:hypothetical protein As57867_014277 [Aphanomyces stellatus]VFT91155.1 Aste57867_14331 [Aphanomyces stellatus]
MWGVVRSTKEIIGQRLRRMSSRVSAMHSCEDVLRTFDEQDHQIIESMFECSDFKQRVLLWLCCHDLQATVDRVTCGGSAHRSTFIQSDTDCFIVGYDDDHRLVEVARVSLLAHIDVTVRQLQAQPLRDVIQHSMSPFAVGRVLIGSRCDESGFPSTILVRHGVHSSPWVA